MAAERSANFDPKTLTSWTALQPYVVEHLQKVYGALTLGLVTAAAGSVMPIYLPFLRVTGFLNILITMGLFFMMHTTPQANVTSRMAYYLGACFSVGVSLFPAVAVFLELDPAILTSALLGTTAIFACFSMAALFSKDRTFLYLGGILSSAMTLMAVMSLANLFIGSFEVFMGVQVYFGLLVFVGFVCFDTQVIIARAEMGDTDYLAHALKLFLDFVNIFVRLLAILSNNKEKKDRRRR